MLKTLICLPQSRIELETLAQKYVLLLDSCVRVSPVLYRTKKKVYHGDFNASLNMAFSRPLRPHLWLKLLNYTKNLKKLELLKEL
jgi:hypothetical protein